MRGHNFARSFCMEITQIMVRLTPRAPRRVANPQKAGRKPGADQPYTRITLIVGAQALAQIDDATIGEPRGPAIIRLALERIAEQAKP